MNSTAQTTQVCRKLEGAPHTSNHPGITPNYQGTRYLVDHRDGTVVGGWGEHVLWALLHRAAAAMEEHAKINLAGTQLSGAPPTLQARMLSLYSSCM